MILKVSNGLRDGWAIYSPVSQVEFYSLTEADIKKEDFVVHKSYMNGKSKELIHATFMEADKQRRIVFNTLAFLCNETGKTIERIQPKE